MNYTKRLYSLTAFAVLFILIGHWWIPADLEPDTVYWIKAIIPNEGLGIAILFTMVGFISTEILMDLRHKKPSGKLSVLKTFYLKNALCILPVYYAFLLVLLALKYPFLDDNLSYFILFISNMQIFDEKTWNSLSHLWVASVIVQFLLIWPLLLAFAKEKYLKYIYFASMMIGISTSVYVMRIQMNWAGFLLLPACLQTFAFGGYYSYLMRTGGKLQALRLLSFVFPVAICLYYYWALTVDGYKYDYCFFTINGIIAVWLIHKSINTKFYFVKRYILENKIIVKIGQMSLSIYLFHFVIHFIYEKLVHLIFTEGSSIQTSLLDWKTAWYFKLILLLLFSFLMHSIIEKPVSKYRMRLNGD